MLITNESFLKHLVNILGFFTVTILNLVALWIN